MFLFLLVCLFEHITRLLTVSTLVQFFMKKLISAANTNCKYQYLKKLNEIGLGKLYLKWGEQSLIFQ